MPRHVAGPNSLIPNLRGHQGFPTVRGAGPAGGRDPPAAGGRRPHPHPGRLGHLRARRRQPGSPRRVPQAPRRLRPRRHPPASDRLHRPVQPRADRRRDRARPNAGQVRAGRPATGPRDFHPARAAGPAGAGARAGRAGREARPARVADLRQRPLRLEGAEALRRGAGREAPRRRPDGRASPRHPGELLRGLQRGRGRPVLAPAGPARQGALPHQGRGRTGRDHPRASPRRPAGRAARGAGQDRGPEVPRALRRRGLLQPPEPRGPAPQRRDRPGEHRGVFPLPRLPGAGHRAREERSAVGDRRDQPLEAPRPGRRRLSDGPEMEDGLRRPPTRPAT